MSQFRADLLDGKSALITGGGSGIGREIARQMGLHGARIIICGRREAVLVETVEAFTAEGITSHYQVADIRDTDAVERVIGYCLADCGGLNILVNNAAGNFPARIEDLSYNAFRTIVDINLQGSFNVTKAAFTAVLKEQGGVVINITAPFEHVGVAWQAHAAAAKSGLISLTRSSAVEWSGLGIRVNAISPGEITATEGVDRLAEQLTRESQARRAGTARDVAMTALFLACDESAYISGQHLCVDGGSGVDLLKIPVYPEI